MGRVRGRLAKFGAAEDGATAVEYGLIAALIVVVVLLAIVGVGGAVDELYRYVSGEAGAAMDGARGGN